MKRKVLLSWSTGKDSAWSACMLMQDPTVDLVGLFCMVNEEHQRTAVHCAPITLLKLQAAAINLPLEIINIPVACPNQEYEAILIHYANQSALKGITHFAYGDVFLEDIKNYRCNVLKDLAIDVLFPLWNRDTTRLANAMIMGGQKALITCINPCCLSEKFLGKLFDVDFIKSLPDGVDPCGENGEFHTFVFDNPLFSNAIDVKNGDIKRGDHYTWLDLS